MNAVLNFGFLTIQLNFDFETGNYVIVFTSGENSYTVEGTLGE